MLILHVHTNAAYRMIQHAILKLDALTDDVYITNTTTLHAEQKCRGQKWGYSSDLYPRR